MLEGCERIARVRQGRLGLGDGRVSVGHHRVKHSRIRVQFVDIGDVRGNRADRRDEAIADCVQVGLRREDRVGLVVGHRQCTQGGVEGARGVRAIGGRGCFCGVERGARRGEERRGLLRVVLKGGEHLRRVERRDAGQLGLRALQIRQLFREALAGLGDSFGERGLLGALRCERRLDGAERVHVGTQIPHDRGRQAELFGGQGRGVHLPLGAEATRDRRLTSFDGSGEFVRGAQAELRARVVELVRRGTHLLICGQELSIRFLSGTRRALGIDLCGLLGREPVAPRRARNSDGDGNDATHEQQEHDEHAEK